MPVRDKSWLTAFGVRWVVLVAAGALVFAASSAHADPLRVTPFHAEPDLQTEAIAVTLLLQANLRDIGAEGHTAGWLARQGTRLRAVVVLHDGAGRDVGREGATAPRSRIDQLANELASAIARRLGASGVRSTQASLGELRPFAQASLAVDRGAMDAAAAFLDSGQSKTWARVPSVRAVATAVARAPSAPFESRFSAALLVRDMQAAQAQFTARLASDRGDKRALAAKARYHLALVDTARATEALSGVRPGKDPFVRLTFAMLHKRDRRQASKYLAPLVRAKYTPALAMIAELPPGALTAKLEKAVLAAARDGRSRWPGLATSLALRAARGGTNTRAALDLVEVAWLGEREVRALEGIAAAARGTDALRLRAELSLRRGDLGAALADVKAALERAPNDPRLLRHLARITSERGEYATAVEIWRRVQKNDVDRRELGRALILAGQRAEGLEVLRALAGEGSAAGQAVDLDLLEQMAAGAAKPGADAGLEKAESGAKADAGPSDVALQNSAGTGKKPPNSRRQSQLDALSEALIPMIQSFPALGKEGIDSVTVVPLAGDGDAFFQFYDTVPAQLERGLAAALKRLGIRVQPATRSTVPEPLVLEQLARLASDAEAGGAMLYALGADGAQAQVRLVVFDAGKSKASTYKQALPGPPLGLLTRNWPLIYGIGILLAFALAGLVVFLLRPRGSVSVALELNPSLRGEVCEIALRRTSKRREIADPEKFAAALRRSGYTRRPLRATLVGKSTQFPRVRVGRWYVHVRGTYRHGGQNVAMAGELTKQIVVSRGKKSKVSFTIDPHDVEIQVTVVGVHGPLSRAKVWVAENPDKRSMTGKDGQAVFHLPLGAWVIEVDNQGKRISKPIEVKGTETLHVSVNFDREELLTQGIALPSVSSSMKNAAIEHANQPPAITRLSPEPGLMDTMAAAAESLVPPPEESKSPPRSPPESSSAPMLADRYLLIEELGRGAMGVVYRAHDQVLERDVAVKLIASELRDNEEARTLFLREARALAALNHPNIVTVYDKGQDPIHAYIVMELVNGTTLESLLAQQSKLDLMDAIRYTDQLSAALAYAHREKVIHRDIKPGNIFITSDGVLKLADFGLARILRGLKLSRTGVRGTPLYMAPEQIHGIDLDFRTDLYAVGCVMYELVTGQPPFVDGDVLYHHVHTPPEPPSSKAPGIPHALDAVILSCLKKEKQHRMPSAEHIRKLLTAIARSLS